MNIGEYIKKIREDKELSINQLALYSNVSAAHISRIERGLREPSPEILEKISEVLKVPYEELMKVAGYLKSDTNIPSPADNKTDNNIPKEKYKVTNPHIKKVVDALEKVDILSRSGDIEDEDAELITDQVEKLILYFRNKKRENTNKTK